MYSVSAFSAKKGVSVGRVRQLIAAGEIPSERSGSSVMIPDHAISWRPRSRRPLSARMAGALLSSLVGEDPLVSARERLRLQGQCQLLRSSENPALLLSDLLAGRGRRLKLSAHPDDLEDFKSDGRVMLSGAHVSEFGLSASRGVEAYVSDKDFDEVVRDYMVREDPAGNIIVRSGSFDPKYLIPLAAADLADWGAGRELREANRVVKHLLKDARC